MQWHIADEEPQPPPASPESGFSRWWLLLPLLLLALLAGWQLNRRAGQAAEAELLEAVRAQFALEQEAFRRGDGELFWAVQSPDAAWFAAQLQPVNQLIYRRETAVSSAVQYGSRIWANLTWPGAAGETWQRVAFYTEQPDGRLRRVPTDPAFWGSRRSINYQWGTLSVHQADQEWGSDIDRFVGATIADICAQRCLNDRLPLQLIIAPDLEPGVRPGQIRIPSPHLLALNGAGQPAELFWAALQTALVDQLTPARIRFAVPEKTDALQDYQQAKRAFEAQFPHIQVEIILLNAAEIAAISPETIRSFDALAFTPHPMLIATGAVRDLTPYMSADPDFDRGDFYEQIWQGAFWRDRAWLLPQAAAMPVLFYDNTAYEAVVQPPPSLRWTWAELEADMAATAVPGADLHQYGFLAPQKNALFSYAYSWQNECTRNTVLCDQPLTAPAVAAALEWYAALVRAEGLHPDITRFTPYHDETTTPYFLLPARSPIRDSWQSARRQAVIWVDWPADYEFRRLLAPLGVTSFPGSERFDGITPLWVYGHFITADSERPLATWQWLHFLSRYPLQLQHRYVPARPSLAITTRYWQTLPRPLNDAMSTAFPFARPVMIGEQLQFSGEQIEAVLGGAEGTAVADTAPPLRWFTEE